MSNYNDTFGRLLRGAINSIAAYEGVTAPAVEEDLGGKIGVAGSAIQRYKTGYLPPEARAVEILAEAAVRRGYLGRAWLARFLQAARYPDPDQLVGRLIDSAVPAGPGAFAAPSGTVTFLFTDIEGSTLLWERHPQAMERGLARHDALLRQLIEANGGQIFKTVGDAFCAAFAVVSDALAAALATQRALQAEPWGEIGAIHVRMALHTGTAHARSGDYFGPALNRIARLLATGHGGQILLSAATQELIHDHLLPDASGQQRLSIELRDLGVHRLKDLARPERIFQVVTPDLPADFPPLAALDSYRHNLPPQPTPLIGRDAEVRAVCDRLRQEDVRLLTLTGPGGVGKTRLALQAAAELLDDPLPQGQGKPGQRGESRFPDGVWFIALAPVRDPDQVAATIAQTLGVSAAGDRPLTAVLKDYLRTKRLLLLLDNFEQVTVARSLVGELLAAAPEVRVLLTSRAALHVYGEFEFAVPPLRVPDPRHMLTPERLSQYEAVRLFIERAQSVRAGFAITSENAPAVAEICARLDGLPLAIELAAARVRLFPPHALQARLGNRLKLLTGGALDLPARQQTLRAAIDWSYDLLDAAEQALFARLAVFVGGCTLEAAEAVLGDAQEPALDGALAAFIPRDLIVDGLASLVEKSLLKQAEGPEGEPRFILLETIREYALERLHTSGEEAALRGRHAEHYTQLAELAEPHIRQPGQMARLRGEHDNLHAALAWALDSGAVELAARTSAALWRYWDGCGRLPAGRAWLAAVLARRAQLSEAVRAKTLWAAGEVAENLDEQRAYFEESLPIFRALGDRAGIASAVSDLGQLARLRGDYAQARLYLEEKLALWTDLGDQSGTILSLVSLGQLALDEGDERRASALHEEALALARSGGHAYGTARALIGLGEVAQRQGAYQQAATHYGEALGLIRELDNSGQLAQLLIRLGELALQQGDLERAAAVYAECLELVVERVDRIGGTFCLAGFAELALARGELEQGARLAGAATALSDALGITTTLSGQTMLTQLVATGRAQLGEAPFASMFAAGSALPWEQAAAAILGEG